MEEKPTTRRALLCKLFFTMLKIGLFTFGGGYAMLALFESEFVDRKKWIDKDEFIDMVAIAESTPGPLAINGATYIGYKIAGFFGALCSTVAVCIPSFAIIYIISLFFDRFLSLTVVSYAFAGIRVSVVWLILSAGVRVFRGLEKNGVQLHSGGHRVCPDGRCIAVCRRFFLHSRHSALRRARRCRILCGAACKERQGQINAAQTVSHLL